MAHPWDTPPKGDFAAYVERLSSLAAQRNLMAQQAARQGMQQLPDNHFGRPESEATAFGVGSAPGPAEQASAVEVAPGYQVPGEHPLARGWRQIVKKLEDNLQDIAQKQKQKQQQQKIK